MAKFAKFHVSAHPEDARTVLHEVLVQNGFRYNWENEHRGLAEKGSKGKSMLLGALAMHYKYALQIDQREDGSHTVSVFLNNTGIAGGAVGYSKVRSQLDELFTALRYAYEVKGALLNAETE